MSHIGKLLNMLLIIVLFAASMIASLACILGWQPPISLVNGAAFFSFGGLILHLAVHKLNDDKRDYRP